jgi:hypothetical protein
VTYGGDLGNRIFFLYWRCPLIRVSVIRGSTVVLFHWVWLWLCGKWLLKGSLPTGFKTNICAALVER